MSASSRFRRNTFAARRSQDMMNSPLSRELEHADHPFYPLAFSTFAVELGMNLLVYGMTQ